MKIILAVNGEEIIVSNEDYDFLNQFTWIVDANGYVRIKRMNGYKGKLHSKSMHRLIMKTPNGMDTDHRDGNKLNNQRSNLRICNSFENMWNRKIQNSYSNKPTSSKYKGVYWLKRNKKWKVHIQVENSRLYIGLFTDEICAANAYNYYARIYHGEFALLNEVPYMSKEEWKKDLSDNQTSQYTGVCWIKIKEKWLAQIWNKETKRNIIIGYFDDEKEAAKAYNKMAIKVKGEKAKLNII